MAKRKRDARKVAGNLLIIFSALLLIFIYLPILKVYLPAKPTSQLNSNFNIHIPRINANAPLIDNVDPWNETEYRKALQKGVAIARGFAKPGESGTVYLFAHSSDSPWRISSYNTVFFRLGELKAGDSINIKYKGKSFDYQVSHSIEVWPGEVEALARQPGNELILQTCTPIGTSLKRMLVFANPI